MDGVKGEISVLAASDQVYNVVTSSRLNESGAIPGTGTTVAGTNYNPSTGAIDITISSYKAGLFAHELLHAYQFENGEISLGASGERGQPFLLDKTDEVAGYARQGLFGSDENVTGASSLPDRYSELPTGPVSIHNFNPAIRDAIKLKNSVGLQRAASFYNQAFRVNGRTYGPK